MADIKLLKTHVKSCMYFNPHLYKLFDRIWIVVPDKEVEHIYNALLKATNHNLDPVYRIVSEKYVLFERTTEMYHGWHIQQDIKIAIGRFIRTPFYMNFDADVFCGRKLFLEDFLNNKQNKSYVRSAIANTFYAVTSGNFKYTCQNLKIPCPLLKNDTIIMGFTPIPFSVNIIDKMTHYFTQREHRSWLKYFMELHMKNQIFTEYLVYWIWSINNKLYDQYHINVPWTQIAQGAEPTITSFTAYFQQGSNRSPFLQIDDNVVNRSVNLWDIYQTSLRTIISPPSITTPPPTFENSKN
jgi:hypothetical protein